MTPAQVVAAAIEALERPDFEELGRQNFRNALHQCHSQSDFARDLGQVQVTKEEVLSPQGVIAVPLKRLGKPVRRLVKIQAFDLHSQVLPLEFKQLPYSGTTLTDYFGIPHRQVFQIVGDCLNIWGLGNSFSSLILTFLTFPEVKTDEETGELVTNSWILQAMPDLVVTSLCLTLAKLTQDQETINAYTQDFLMKSRFLLQSYGTEILSANSFP